MTRPGETPPRPVRTVSTPQALQMKGAGASLLAGMALLQVRKYQKAGDPDPVVSQGELVAVGRTIRSADRSATISGILRAGAWLSAFGAFAYVSNSAPNDISVSAVAVGGLLLGALAYQIVSCVRTPFKKREQRLREGADVWARQIAERTAGTPVPG